MKRFDQQLCLCFVLLSCSLAHAKPGISIGPEGFQYSLLDSHFGTPVDPEETGSDEPDILEATSKAPMKLQATPNDRQSIRFPGRTNIQPIEFPNQEPTTGIQSIRFPSPTNQKRTTNKNNEPIKFPGPTNKKPTTNNGPIKFPGPTNRTPATNSNAKSREDRCNLPSEMGWCRALFEMWYFDVNSGDCETFIYSGCQGNDNRFSSEEECRDVCVVKTGSPKIVQKQTLFSNE